MKKFTLVLVLLFTAVSFAQISNPQSLPDDDTTRDNYHAHDVSTMQLIQAHQRTHTFGLLFDR